MINHTNNSILRNKAYLDEIEQIRYTTFNGKPNFEAGIVAKRNIELKASDIEIEFKAGDHKKVKARTHDGVLEYKKH